VQLTVECDASLASCEARAHTSLHHKGFVIVCPLLGLPHKVISRDLLSQATPLSGALTQGAKAAHSLALRLARPLVHNS